MNVLSNYCEVESSEIVKPWLGTGQNHRVEYGYGNKGELVEETDAMGRTSKYTYDSTKTFPVTIVNPLGHPTHFSYDLGTGDLLWQEKNEI